MPPLAARGRSPRLWFMTGIILPRDDIPLSESKSGDSYDRCPSCDREVELRFKSGGRSPKGEYYQDWAIYHCSPKEGGCGLSWDRTTKQGVELAHQRGFHPKRLTRDAQVNRTYFYPTEKYRQEYDRIFRKRESGSGRSEERHA